MKQRFYEFASAVPTNHQNPSLVDLHAWTSASRISNQYNLPTFKTKITARSAQFTDISSTQNQASFDELRLKVFDFINPADFILIKLLVGKDPIVKLKTTVLIAKANANIALMLNHNFYSSDHDVHESDILTLDVPHYPKRRVLVDPKDRMTLVLGIDYYGEMKMSILRMAMEIMRKDRQGLGLHAGSKIFLLKNETGQIQKKGALIFGLSGTGKTTLTCHDHGLVSPESVVILQDDINLITGDGTSFGSEKGFYVKCDACPEHEQITSAVLSEGAILENVFVNDNGDFEWKNTSHTRNSRAIIDRHKLQGTGDTIDLPSLDFILYNTRRPELPPIGRLTSPQQGGAFYGLGESIITSAEDPERAGESKRQVGFDPFILGSEAININRIRDIITKKPNLQCFVLNTGFVGDETNDITIPITLACIEQAVRGELDWVYDAALGYEIPKTVKGFDWENLSPRKYYGNEKYESIMQDLKSERINHLSKFSGVDKEIIDSL